MAEKRKLFEEVGAETPKQAPTGGMIDKASRGARGAIRIWLMVLFVLVVVMIAVGGLTRLTDSGLSITEWKPVTGALPPMSEAAWTAEFDKYREIPEYQLQNKGMSMSEFKTIYWWEWGHRQLGRLIGVVWALGFFGFLLAGRMPRGTSGIGLLYGGIASLGIGALAIAGSIAGLLPLDTNGLVAAMIAALVVFLLGFMREEAPDWIPRLLFIGLLGALQGAVGWWMVHSGLSGERLDVASYRLATHLGVAFVILGYIAWYTYALARPERDLMQARRLGEAKLFGMTTGLLHFAFLQILLGALVAGIDAGRNYPSWPLMEGGLWPSDMFVESPAWRNFFENPGLVQFMHRMAGYLLFAFGVVVWLRGRRSANSDTRYRYNAMFAMLLLQVVIGIVTVVYMAPLHIAILHQFGAVLLWALILRARFAARYPVPQSVRGPK
ncbi:heme A synthase [Sagittula sp. P11]|uniref:COX15/CtaA family protein n=2 Tax=unclassified Sagittula TaxID=2624628 RepID=UPI000C2CEEB5|nr:COX15/CtaA family protein [Sagittula sp. P11]AUC55360.1 heme A synthase [Sagittula sp. P11]